MKLHVLQVCCEMPPLNGGIGTAVADLAPALADHGIHLRILGLYPPALLKKHRLPAFESTPAPEVHRIPSPWARLPLRWRLPLERRTLRHHIARLHRQQTAHLLFADDYEGWLPLSPDPALPIVTRLNGSNRVYDRLLQRPGHPLLHQTETAQLARSAAWIGVSRFFLDQTSHITGLPAPPIAEVIPNAIDASAFHPLDPCIHPTIPGRIVLHNTLGPRKGIHDLLTAFAHVITTRPDATLVLCGSPPNPSWLEARLGELPPKARAAVTLAGRLDRHGALQTTLGSAAVACYPSHLETFGLAPVEAMAMERVTVYADCGPAHEVITHGHDGFICPPSQPEALAHSLLHALSLSPADRHRIGQAARTTVLKRFDRPIVATQTAALLHRLRLKIRNPKSEIRDPNH